MTRLLFLTSIIKQCDYPLRHTIVKTLTSYMLERCSSGIYCRACCFRRSLAENLGTKASPKNSSQLYNNLLWFQRYWKKRVARLSPSRHHRSKWKFLHGPPSCFAGIGPPKLGTMTKQVQTSQNGTRTKQERYGCRTSTKVFRENQKLFLGIR